MTRHGSSGANNFNGIRVVAFESRMADETRALIERFGGEAIIAPALREVPLLDNHAALEFAPRLMSGTVGVVILTTGIGLRELMRVMETRFARDELAAALAKTVTVARGPKPAAALRELGLTPSMTAPEPNTWREILNALSANLELAGRTVAVQEYGVANRDLIAGLEARGAHVISVPVYRWTLPEDRAPIIAALHTIIDGGAGAVLFTSSAQVVNVMQLAEVDKCDDALRVALESVMVASIGPVCSRELREHGLPVDLEPSHPKLGHLIKEVAGQAAATVKRKCQTAPIEVINHDAPAAVLTPISRPYNPALLDHPIMRACRLEAASYTPIWLMRQAGRYMKEYRDVRARYSFLEMCRQPELATEVTVTAVERLGVDAAIIFADILLPLVPMGVGLDYVKGDGPVIAHPLRSERDLDRIAPVAAADALSFVGEAIRLTRRALNNRVPLIGFAGAPFTLASYLIEGGASRQYQATKTLMYTAPATWHRMMAMLAGITTDYLKMQVVAGADLVQLFDSWVGSLGPDDYRRYVLPHTRSVIAAIRPLVPVIHFGTVTGNLLELMREAGGDIIGLDWRVDLAEAWARLGNHVGVQGNLDPMALFAATDEIRRRAQEILARAAGRPGHIFNLGHGILPDTRVENVIALVEAVHELSQR
ncbi:MAG: uroporphyrinogen decarboxylase [Candidatus Binataceae bacterium]